MSNIRKVTGLEVATIDHVTKEDLGRLYCVVDNKIQFVETRNVAIVNSDSVTPTNPVVDWDMTGVIACWHNDYKLGHIQPKVDPQEYRIELIEEFEAGFCERLDARVERFQDSLTMTDIVQKLTAVAELTQDIVDKKFDEHYLSLPLYLHDHGVISMNSGRYSCPWDTSQVGFIYVSKQDARTTWGRTNLTKARIQHVYQLLKAEVKEYDLYLRGDSWEYHVNQEAWDPISEAWEVVESNLASCSGFLGEHGDPVTTGILDHLEDDVDIIHNTVFDDTYEVANLRSQMVAA